MVQATPSHSPIIIASPSKALASHAPAFPFSCSNTVQRRLSAYFHAEFQRGREKEKGSTRSTRTKVRPSSSVSPLLHFPHRGRAREQKGTNRAKSSTCTKTPMPLQTVTAGRGRVKHIVKKPARMRTHRNSPPSPKKETERGKKEEEPPNAKACLRAPAFTD